jgi:glycosyltransferase involved in cell wall biosynthesis
MKSIFAMCLVKNEADIISQCLRAAATWCDRVIVYDNGSEDDTWSIVRELSKHLSCVIPFRRDHQPFSDSLRSEMFEAYRALSTEGDWWCRLDADEIYIDNPRLFLAQVPASYNLVWSASFQYYFTEVDAARYQADPHAFEDHVNIEQRCRYYRNDWSEPRFFRYRKILKYGDRDWPVPLEHPYAKRIRLKHYQYRSPRQITQRLLTRRTAMASGLFRHEMIPNWRYRINQHQPILTGTSSPYFPSSWEERVVDSLSLLLDDGSNNYVIQERVLPPIRGMR